MQTEFMFRFVSVTWLSEYFETIAFRLMDLRPIQFRISFLHIFCWLKALRGIPSSSYLIHICLHLWFFEAKTSVSKTTVCVCTYDSFCLKLHRPRLPSIKLDWRVINNSLVKCHWVLSSINIYWVPSIASTMLNTRDTEINKTHLLPWKEFTV